MSGGFDIKKREQVVFKEFFQKEEYVYEKAVYQKIQSIKELDGVYLPVIEYNDDKHMII